MRTAAQTMTTHARSHACAHGVQTHLKKAVHGKCKGLQLVAERERVERERVRERDREKREREGREKGERRDSSRECDQLVAAPVYSRALRMRSRCSQPSSRGVDMVIVESVEQTRNAKYGWASKHGISVTIIIGI
jgi:hypothetical protein